MLRCSSRRCEQQGALHQRHRRRREDQRGQRCWVHGVAHRWHEEGGGACGRGKQQTRLWLGPRPSSLPVNQSHPSGRFKGKPPEFPTLTARNGQHHDPQPIQARFNHCQSQQTPCSVQSKTRVVWLLQMQNSASVMPSSNQCARDASIWHRDKLLTLESRQEK